jgi:hypothetical protein
VSMQDKCTVCAKHSIGSEIVSNTPNGTLGYELNWKFVLVSLEIVLILTKDRCTVCAERIIGSEIILDAPDGTPT